MIAVPVINQPSGSRETERTLVAMKVAVREVKTRRYHIFGLVYS